MSPVPVPTHVEFVVVVDWREGTPTRRCAVLRVYVWPDRVVAERGEYA